MATHPLTRRSLLVLGGQGITGRAIVDVAKDDPAWNVMTGSRRAADNSGSRLCCTVRDCSPSPMTRLNRLMSASTSARQL